MLGSLGTLGNLAGLDPTNIGSIATAVGASAEGITAAASSIESQVSFWTSPSKIVTVFLGLLLIAAGLFSFDKTREIIVPAVKKAAAGAA